MSDQGKSWTRREFVGGLTLATSTGFGMRAEPAAAEPPPETTRLRLARIVSTCVAPYFLAKDFLPAEGFTDVRYVEMAGTLMTKAVVNGDIDIGMNFSGPLITRLDAGDPIVILAGIHVGCFQLFGGERVRAIRDLKGKTVALFNDLGSPEHIFLASMAAHVGVDPRKEIRWLTHPFDESTRLLAEARSTLSWRFHRRLRNCAPGRSDTWWSTVTWTGPGHSTSAAWPMHTGTSCTGVRWPSSGLSERC